MGCFYPFYTIKDISIIRKNFYLVLALGNFNLEGKLKVSLAPILGFKCVNNLSHPSQFLRNRVVYGSWGEIPIFIQLSGGITRKDF